MAKTHPRVRQAVTSALTLFVAVPLPAAATAIGPLPEPSVLGLIFAGAVAGVVVWALNRRK